MAEYNGLTDFGGLTNGDIVTYSYTGSLVSLYLPKGKYRLKCYGAQGGYRSTASYGGQGGYAEGVLDVESATTAFVYVGGSGNTGGQSGGFNGGGTRTNNLPGGGGASDIRLGTDSLFARVIVAGGGGSDGASSRPGKAGGGLTGVSATESYGSGGGGGTQTSGGTGGNNNNGSFGIGGEGQYRSSGYGGAGGGGWYGGGGTYPDGSADDDRGGGGGSGYVLTADSVKPDGYLLGAEYYLTETALTQGSRDGNGLVIIEIIEIEAQKFLARDDEGIKAWNGDVVISASFTAPSLTPSVSSLFDSTYTANNAIDGNTETYWCAENNTVFPQWYKVDLSSSARCVAYAIRGRHDATDGNPQSWEFQGFDGAAWVTLDNRTGTSWLLGERKIFTINNNADFMSYRVYITENGGRHTVAIAELELQFEAVAADADVVGEWILISDVISEDLFLEHGIDRLPQSINGLLDDAEILLWTDNEEIRDAPENFSLQLNAKVTAPTQTITQVAPFDLPNGAVVDRFTLVKDEQNSAVVSAAYEVKDNDKILFTYTLEKPSEQAVAGVNKINIFFGGTSE